MDENVFSQTSRFTRAVQLINEVDSSRLPKLLSRIAEKLHVKDERAFTEDELSKLQNAFDVNMTDINLLLETLEFMFLQAAYYNLKSNALHQQLLLVNVSSNSAEIIAQIWSNFGKSAIEKMRKYPISQNQLDSVDWHMNLQLAQNTKTQMKETNAIFQLNFRNNETDAVDKISLEFNHENLMKFYNQLEMIQSQLDSLS